MTTAIKDKFIERIDQVLEKAERVKATYQPNQPGVIEFPTLNPDAFNVHLSNLRQRI